MERERIIVEILAVGVMNHGPSTVKRTNREFTNWDFRGRANKSGPPLVRNQVYGLLTRLIAPEELIKSRLLNVY